MTETEFAQRIEEAIWEAVDNGPSTPAFVELEEELQNVTPLDQSGYLTNDTGLVFELADGSRFIVTVQRTER